MNNNSFHEIFNNSLVRVAIIGVLSTLSIYLLAQTMNAVENFGRSEIPANETITVRGDGKASMPPDVARISFTVQNTLSTVAEAQAATTKQTNAAIDFVKTQGIEEKDIKTLSYNIFPQYSYQNHFRSAEIIGYQVSQTIQVTVRDFSVIGEFLSGIGKLEVQNVSGPSFTLDDPTVGYDAARADAINKAKAQAQLLSEQLDVRLVKIVSFYESFDYKDSRMHGYRMGNDMTVTETSDMPELPIGENIYNVSVFITYEIR